MSNISLHGSFVWLIYLLNLQKAGCTSYFIFIRKLPDAILSNFLVSIQLKLILVRQHMDYLSVTDLYIMWIIILFLEWFSMLVYLLCLKPPLMMPPGHKALKLDASAMLRLEDPRDRHVHVRNPEIIISIS